MSALFGWGKKKHDKKGSKDNTVTSAGSPKKKGETPKQGGSLTDVLSQDSRALKQQMGSRLLWFHGNINRRLAETKLKNGKQMIPIVHPCILINLSCDYSNQV